MSYKQEKPYTDKDKADFIFKYNQDCFQEGYNCRIEETETALYALEDNELLVNDEVIIDPDYEEKQRIKERERLDALTLTPADVERALYKAKNMDFEDLKQLIAQQIPTIDIKGLAIEFRAKDFYRGAMASGLRLFDVVGALLGYSTEDMDYLFENKELPE